MAGMTFASYNTRGLNNPSKWGQILYHLHKKQIMVAMFQEMHFRGDSIPRCSQRYYNKWHHSTHPTIKACGESIAFHKHISYALLASIAHPQGRYLFLKIQYVGSILTIANVYFPNQIQGRFGTLGRFAEGSDIVLGGDFNLVFDPARDISTGSSFVSSAAERQVRQGLIALKLVYMWRILHPGDRNFSHHSLAHNTYSHYRLYFHIPLAVRQWTTVLPWFFSVVRPSPGHRGNLRSPRS
ncbi:Endonuclease/Exonuclease/phosphatase family [Pristimantis euphronides]